MSINEENKTAMIDQYLSGQLSGDALAEFEAQMDRDPALAYEVALQSKIVDGIQKHERDTLQKQLDAIHTEMTAEGAPTIPLYRKTRYLVAASVSILCLMVGGYFAFLKPAGGGMAYLTVQLPPGARGLDKDLGKMGLEIIKDHPDYQRHYQLGKTLTLYGDFSLEGLVIMQNPNDQAYYLEVNGEVVPLVASDEVLPLP